MTERDKVKQRITALLNKTVDRGCNEHEALFAAEKAAELMAHYDIEATELDFKSRSCVKRTTAKKKYGNKKLGSYISVAVANLCDCRCWGDGQGNLTFFGFEQDAEIAVYIYDLLSNALVNELAAYKESGDYWHLHSQGYHGRSLAASFLNGMENRLVDRLNEMAANKAQEMQESTGRDLVPVKQEQVNSEYDDLGLKLVSRRTSRTSNSSGAYTAGSAAGSRVNIGAGVGGQGRKALT